MSVGIDGCPDVGEFGFEFLSRISQYFNFNWLTGLDERDI